MKMTESVRILVINLSRLGDFVSSFAAINALKKRYGQVDILCKQPYRDLVANETDLNAVDEGEVLRQKYDIVIDMTSTSRTRRIIRKIDADIKVGSYGSLIKRLKYACQRIYTHTVRQRRYRNIVKDYSSYLQVIGLDSFDVPRLNKILDPEIELLYGMPGGGLKIGLHVSGTDLTRHIPARLAREISGYYSSMGVSVVLIGKESDARDSGLGLEGVYHRNETIRELVAIISQLDCVIGPDSGIIHLTSALDVPGVALYGTNLIEEYGPPGESIGFIEKELECRPCDYRDNCPWEVKCMNDISLDEVRAAVDIALKKKYSFENIQELL